MKKYLTIILLCIISVTAHSQKRHDKSKHISPIPGNAGLHLKKDSSDDTHIKPYKEIITKNAVSHQGLFTIHQVGEKWYFEIPDSLLNRDILIVNRFIKTPVHVQNGGEEAGTEKMVRWEKGQDNKIFLRLILNVLKPEDSTDAINRAVANSSEDAIVAAFDIKAYGKSKDSSSTSVIDVTDFFKGDNPITGIPGGVKMIAGATALAPDRSYIESIHTYPINIEIKTVKTFNASPTSSLTGGSGAITFEFNNSMLLLPKKPMRKRLFDPRVGYFTSSYSEFSDSQQRVKTIEFIHRWRLEPKDEDIEKWKRGELVEPKKQIVIYIDPATPKQWRPYLIAGINDWQKAFEQAGFKNAIIGKEWPDGDTTMSLEDARYSVLRYFASEEENAYGPNVADPRSGEILETHIGWYHNVMKLVHDWYLIQAGLSDPRARHMKFSDSLMGDLIRFVSSHEVGHTLGLRHNMGSSSTIPVEMLRNKKWLDLHGHTPSIMDYARFNYVAQPEDGLTPNELYPHIGEYDRWAIEWGYKLIPSSQNEDDDKKILNKLALDSLGQNPRLWFGGEGMNYDPRAQSEDLGNNNMKAGEYGIKNLKRIITQLPSWTNEDEDMYGNLGEMYNQLLQQFQRYIDHVIKNIGGIYETFKSNRQSGDVYMPAPKALQTEALDFLNKQVFTTPLWLLNKDIINKIIDPNKTNIIPAFQSYTLHSLFSSDRLMRLSMCSDRYGDEQTLTPDALISKVTAYIWSELKTDEPISNYRREQQLAYLDAVASIFRTHSANIMQTDIPAIFRQQLEILKKQIISAIPKEKDELTAAHLQQALVLVKQILLLDIISQTQNNSSIKR